MQTRHKTRQHAVFWPARNTATDPVAKERAYDDVEDVVEMQLHIGSKVMPQYPIRSVAEFAYRLDQALDLTASTEGISILGGTVMTSLSVDWTVRRPAVDQEVEYRTRASIRPQEAERQCAWT